MRLKGTREEVRSQELRTAVCSTLSKVEQLKEGRSIRARSPETARRTRNSRVDVHAVWSGGIARRRRTPQLNGSSDAIAHRVARITVGVSKAAHVEREIVFS